MTKTKSESVLSNFKKIPWLIENDPEESDSTDVQARLCSSKIPMKLEIKCFVVFYSLELGEPEGRISQTKASLSLLQRQSR